MLDTVLCGEPNKAFTSMAHVIHVHSTQGMFLVMVFTILLVGARRNLGSSTSPSTVALGAAGLVMYALGGLTWNVDNHFCRRLGQARSPYGPLPPAARPLTQLHAWWHLFSGLGTYLLLLAGLTMRLRCCIGCSIA